MFPLSLDDEIFEMRALCYQYFQYMREMFLYGMVYTGIILGILLICMAYVVVQTTVKFYRTTIPKTVLAKEARVISSAAATTSFSQAQDNNAGGLRRSKRNTRRQNYKDDDDDNDTVHLL